MQRTVNTSLSKVLALAVTVIAASAISAKADRAYQVSVDTSSLDGTVGNIDFQFNRGGSSSQAALVSISSFMGAMVGGTPSKSGGASGDLSSTVTIDNSTQFDDYYQDITFGPSLSFFIDFSGPAVDAPSGGQSGSSFGLSLYDAAGNTPLLTNDPNGFIGTVDVNPNGTFAVSTFPSDDSGGAPAATFVLSSAPEPDTFVVFGAATLSLGKFRRGIARRRRGLEA